MSCGLNELLELEYSRDEDERIRGVAIVALASRMRAGANARVKDMTGAGGVYKTKRTTE